MKVDHYIILGLKPTASNEEIKSAYKKLTQKYHPDKTGMVDSEKFQEVCTAYYVLRDEHRRFLHNIELMDEMAQPVLKFSRIDIKV